LFFGETTTAENYRKLFAQFIGVAKEIKRPAGFRKMGCPPILRKQQLSCTVSLQIVFSGVDFGHDLQPLGHMT
jgi:hypothetical protein